MHIYFKRDRITLFYDVMGKSSGLGKRRLLFLKLDNFQNRTRKKKTAMKKIPLINHIYVSHFSIFFFFALKNLSRFCFPSAINFWPFLEILTKGAATTWSARWVAQKWGTTNYLENSLASALNSICFRLPFFQQKLFKNSEISYFYMA